MKIIIAKSNADALAKVCIERECNYQFHETEDPNTVAAYISYGEHDISTITAFFMGAAWMLEQEKESLKELKVEPPILLTN